MTRRDGSMAAIYRFFNPCILGIHPNYKILEGFVKSLTSRFLNGEGVVIHKGRNELRRMECEGQTFVVKSFHQPHLINRFIYGVFRASKSKRSYMYAQRFLEIGVGTPQPVAWMDERSGLLFNRSYYVSCLSPCTHTYSDLFDKQIDYVEDVVRAIGRTTAILHENGYVHKDYGRGNILFQKQADGEVKIEIVDLNRMRLGHVSMRTGCKNFERLPATPQMHRCMAEEYAKVRGFDAEKCYEMMAAFRSKQEGKIDGLY